MRTFVLGASVLMAATIANAASPDALGPLQIHPENSRYFADGAGRAVWLTGSHTWANLHERGVEGETPDFDFERYLDFLQQHGHNFIRLWAWEQAQWMQFVPKEVPVRYSPLAYQRTGPGKALDGKPTFDLTKFNDGYFKRLRSRVEQAKDRRIYVGVMFFQGFSLDKRRGNVKMGNAWRGHPFHRDNNVNGIDGNPSDDDTGHEVHELKVTQVTRLQEDFLRKVIDTLGDLDNVLWEIGNECHDRSVSWQTHMVQFVKRYEATRDKQHLVGMTGAPIKAAALFASPADWISPPGKEWLTNPPVNDGRKIVLVDNDHCDPWHHSVDWVWKSFMRGHHFILMDGYMDYRLDSPAEPDVQWDTTRNAMGRVRDLSEQLDLAAFAPRPGLASTRYCLASPKQYLAYLPKGGAVDMDLRALPGPLAVEWINAVSGQRRSGQPPSEQPRSRLADDRSQPRHFASPFSGAALLLLTGREENGN